MPIFNSYFDITRGYDQFWDVEVIFRQTHPDIGESHGNSQQLALFTKMLGLNPIFGWVIWYSNHYFYLFSRINHDTSFKSPSSSCNWAFLTKRSLTPLTPMSHACFWERSSGKQASKTYFRHWCPLGPTLDRWRRWQDVFGKAIYWI